MRTFFLTVFFSICTLFSVSAQRSNRDTDKPEENSFKSKLWYGGALNLGNANFGGSNFFGIGVSPMMGYKIIPNLSVGPRVSILFGSAKERGFPATSLFNTEAGAFVRYKIFRGFFIQGEVSNEWVQTPIGMGEKQTVERFNQYIGAGYNWGNGGFGQEMGIYYNFAIARDLDSFQQPFGLRIGFTYKF
jgi:hypothetical protein